MQKVTKAKSFEAKITKNWKDYNKFVELIGLVKEHHINPFVFFYFKIQDLRDKKIFPKISNVVTKKAVEHFLGWRKKNQYKVSVITQEKTYEQEWLNQLSLDVQSLVTYELRKPVVSLMKPEGFIFSGLGKCLLNHFQHIGFTVDSEESQHWSELVANETLFRKALEHWNGCLSKEALKLGSLYHSMRDRKFIEKLDALTKLLSVLKVAIP